MSLAWASAAPSCVLQGACCVGMVSMSFTLAACLLLDDGRPWTAVSPSMLLGHVCVHHPSSALLTWPDTRLSGSRVA